MPHAFERNGNLSQSPRDTDEQLDFNSLECTLHAWDPGAALPTFCYVLFVQQRRAFNFPGRDHFLGRVCTVNVRRIDTPDTG